MKLKHLAPITAAILALALFAGCNYMNTNPDANNPGTTSPGMTSPGTNSPGTASPGTTSPGTTTNPGATSPASIIPDEVLPGATPGDTTPAETVPTLSTDFSEIGALDGDPITWGPGVRKNAAGRSEACDLLQEAYGDYNALFIEADEKVVYLTFDQGYENGYTAKILDVLKEKGVKAVFFLTGHYINTAPELVQRMIDEGHVLGNHSYNHPNYAAAKLEDAFEDMNRLHEAVYDKWGYTMRLFRFPEGVFSERTLGLVKSTGYTSAFWSFAYADWNPDNQMEPDVAVARVLEGAHNGCIFLFHTVGETNSIILGEVIDKLSEQGYGFGQLKPVGAPAAEAEKEQSEPAVPESSSQPKDEGNYFLRPRG